MFSEQHEMFRAAVRAFVEREVMPHVEEWETAGRIPTAIFRRMGELSFLGVLTIGGSTSAIMREIIGKELAL